MDNITDFSNRNPRRRALKVRAFGNSRGWFFFLHSTDGRLLGSGCGPLPLGFNFNPDTAILFSLAQAHRHIARCFSGARVAMVCTAAPAVRSERRRLAA